MNDMRLHQQLTRPTCYENVHHESRTAQLIHVLPSFFTEPSGVAQYVPIKQAAREKLIFAGRIYHNPTDSQESAPVE